MIYSLSYELKSTDRDYAPLFSYLETGIGRGGIHVLRDSWWIASDSVLDVNSVCEQIRRYMGEKDHLYFGRIDDSNVNGWLPSSAWQWFNSHK